MLVLTDSSGQGVYSWDVGQALSASPINVLLPPLSPRVNFHGLVMSLSLPHRLKGKIKIDQTPGLLFKLRRTIYLLVFAEIWDSPGIIPSPRYFHPSLVSPEQIHTFPVRRYSTKAVSTEFTHTIVNQCADAQRKGSTSKQIR